jgi:hypothetical protein
VLRTHPDLSTTRLERGRRGGAAHLDGDICANPVFPGSSSSLGRLHLKLLATEGPTVPSPAQRSEHSERPGPEGPTWAGVRPVRPAGAVRDVERPGRSTRSVLQLQVDSEARELLARISEEEQLAVEVQSELDGFLGWPSWSMDMGLTPAQETFVEHWSPQRVLDDKRLLRELVGLLRRCSSARGDVAGLREALTILTKLDPR